LIASPAFGFDFKDGPGCACAAGAACNAGAAVLVASDDLDELLTLADRLLVIRAAISSMKFR
jgi:ABC-type uncharacterized transport system ATPase subunit